MKFISIKENEMIYHINISHITAITYNEWLENNGNILCCTVCILEKGSIIISKAIYNKLISEINETNI